jgi:hypothetical protein
MLTFDVGKADKIDGDAEKRLEQLLGEADDAQVKSEADEAAKKTGVQVPVAPATAAPAAPAPAGPAPTEPVKTEPKKK